MVSWTKTVKEQNKSTHTHMYENQIQFTWTVVFVVKQNEAHFFVCFFLFSNTVPMKRWRSFDCAFFSFVCVHRSGINILPVSFVFGFILPCIQTLSLSIYLFSLAHPLLLPARWLTGCLTSWTSEKSFSKYDRVLWIIFTQQLQVNLFSSVCPRAINHSAHSSFGVLHQTLCSNHNIITKINAIYSIFSTVRLHQCS